MRAKLIDGELIYPPYTHTNSDGCTCVGYPQREDLLIADGWKTVEDVAHPATGLWVGSWLESETAITRVWTPREKTDAEKAYDAEVAECQAAAEAATTARTAKLKVMRDSYADATAQLCQLAGLPVVRVLGMVEIQAAVLPLLATEQAGMVNGLLTFLTNLEGKLCREDGLDALDRM